MKSVLWEVAYMMVFIYLFIFPQKSCLFRLSVSLDIKVCTLVETAPS